MVDTWMFTVKFFQLYWYLKFFKKFIGKIRTSWGSFIFWERGNYNSYLSDSTVVKWHNYVPIMCFAIFLPAFRIACLFSQWCPLTRRRVVFWCSLSIFPYIMNEWGGQHKVACPVLVLLFFTSSTSLSGV